MIKNFNDKEINEIQSKINEFLKDIALEYNIRIKYTIELLNIDECKFDIISKK